MLFCFYKNSRCYMEVYEMVAYDYSCMTCDGCGKTFPTFNNELVMQYKYG